MKRVGDVASEIIQGINVRAIPAIYKGIEYRSRLEARWAVFFDCLGIEHHFEFEGFELEDERYLPDFWLPALDCYVEVKPTNVECGTRAFRVAELLAMGSGKRVFVTTGAPDSENGLEVFIPLSGDAITWDCGYEFCVCPKCGALGVEFEGRYERICKERCFPGRDRGYWRDCPQIREAKVKAHGARFWR